MYLSLDSSLLFWVEGRLGFLCGEGTLVRCGRCFALGLAHFGRGVSF